MSGWEDARTGGWEGGTESGRQEERNGGGGKDGEKEKTKPYTTIPSRGFAPGKLPLDRPHQGAAMLKESRGTRLAITPLNKTITRF